MPAYLIAQVQIRDPDAYSRYTARTPDIIARHGGRFVVRGGHMEALEGNPRTRRVVVIEFASMEAARTFYHSQEYQDVKGIRTAASEAEFLLVEGV